MLNCVIRSNIKFIEKYSLRLYCSSAVDSNAYLKLTNETLESINDRFSELIEDYETLDGGDTTLSDGVLTVKLNQYGTYVINKQSPNKQIWLSSPVSGPYRYDILKVINTYFTKIKLIIICRIDGFTSTLEKLFIAFWTEKSLNSSTMMTQNSKNVLWVILTIPSAFYSDRYSVAVCYNCQRHFRLVECLCKDISYSLHTGENVLEDYKNKIIDP